MTDYKNGKIYIIKSNETDEFYIGSTCSTLKDRFCKHKSAHKSAYKSSKKHFTASKILKYSDAYIELLEDFPCKLKKELLDREGVLMKENPKCVNTQIQGRTMAEYRKDNDEKLKQQGIEYRIKNKEILKERFSDWKKTDKARAYYEKQKITTNVKVKCPDCDKEISKSNLLRHRKTKH
jgi:hypothetical protein